MTRRATGGLIDRATPLHFTFDGRALSGFAGDTLASALVANGVRLIGRSFKYHRPRGILTAGSEEPNALVTLRTGAAAEPNTRATTVELFDGLAARSQNRWPSLRFDALAVNQLFAPLFVAGFYYKTFMWPAAFWEKLYEPLIRRAAGLGALSMEPDPDAYDHAHAFCDLLVIGGGPAGLAAALTAGRAGLRVVLANDDPRAGGRLLAENAVVDDVPGHEWAGTAIAELAGMANVRVLARTAVIGVYDGCEYAAVERVADHLPSPVSGQPRQRLWKIVATRAILATGATERPLVFGGNDRPGGDDRLGGVHLCQSLRGAAGPARGGHHHQRQRLADRARSGEGRGHRGRDRRSAPDRADAPRGDHADPQRHRNHARRADLRRVRIAGAQGGGGQVQRPGAPSRLRSGRHGGRMEPGDRAGGPSRRAAAVVGGKSTVSCWTRHRRGWRQRVPPPANSRSARRWPTGWRRRSKSAPRWAGIARLHTLPGMTSPLTARRSGTTRRRWRCAARPSSISSTM
ncbi:2Fe-2S iron-sulfur cluster-binding protein [Novosphingobium colocasiae]